MKKVDFIVIGSMKAGSTSIVDYISRHPSVCFSSTKEPQYFSRNEKYQKGLDWYEAFFSGCASGKILGEGSTCYTRWPKYDRVPERLYEYNSELKLIYIVRQPVDRAYSHYRHSMLKNEFYYKSFMDALISEREIVDASKYMMQIERYVPFFPKTQMHFLKFEDVVASDIDKFKGLQRFLSLHVLGLDEMGPATKSNPAGGNVLRNRAVSTLREYRKAPILSSVIDNMLTPVGRSKVLNGLVSGYEKSFFGKRQKKKIVSTVPAMTREDYQYVMSECAGDMKKFEEFSGLDLSEWY